MSCVFFRQTRNDRGFGFECKTVNASGCDFFRHTRYVLMKIVERGNKLFWLIPTQLLQVAWKKCRNKLDSRRAPG